MVAIPLYRAKKIDSDEWVEGYYTYDRINFSLGQHTIVKGIAIYIIDPSTLAIHFDKMSRNKKSKVFFSLQEDGRGGDKVDYGFSTYYAIYNIKKDKLEFVSINDDLQRLDTMANVEVIGIHKGE